MTSATSLKPDQDTLFFVTRNDNDDDDDDDNNNSNNKGIITFRHNFAFLFINIFSNSPYLKRK